MGKLKRRQFTAARPRADLIASYGYAITQADRDKGADSGAALPDGSYLITECEGDSGSVDAAIHAVGRGGSDHDTIRKHIIKRAGELGCASKIPDDWNQDGSLKDAATAARTSALAQTPPPPPAAKPKGAVDDPDADQAVSAALGEVQTALEKAIAAQKNDPDAASDPNDEKVTQGLAQMSDLLATVTKAQAADMGSDADQPPAAKPASAKPPAQTAAAPPPPAQAPAPAQPKTNPVDDDGNVDGTVKCANPDCGHLASAHVDTPGGANTGACSMANCSCQGMQVESEPNSGDGDDQAPDQGTQGAQPGPESEELAAAPGNAVPDAPAPPAAAPAPSSGPSTLNSPPQLPGSENMGPAFCIPVGIIEGQPTGDGRQIAPGALTWRTPPLPLMGLATETHDPEGFDQNDPAVLCGRIDSLQRVAGEGDTQIVMARGYYLPNEDGQYFAGLTEAMGRCGISADVAVSSTDVQVVSSDADGFPIEMSETLTEGQIMGFTQVPFPAFEGAYIVLGDGTEKPAAQTIPQAAEAPATPAKPPAAVTAGGQLIHLMAYEACEPCQQGVDVITASGAGPERPPKAWFSNPNFTEGDGRLVEILDRRGQRAMGGKFACPLTVTDDGRVYGHLAPWDVCHIGKPGCVTAPHSASDYAYFKRGQHVITAEGERIRVGTLTVDAGHAGLRDSATAAMAHYDNIATCVADVNCGEDDYGIWIAGAIRPTATAQQVQALRASSVSGDWRGLGGALELVAALAVPVPGFPHAVVADGAQESLVAAGAGVMHALKHPEPPPQTDPGDAALRRALSPLLGDARAKARQRLAALR